MKYNLWLLVKLLVLPFYKENTGVFFFLFVILFGVVNMVDGAGIFEYHYSLAKGMLAGATFMLPVLAAWVLYLRKGVAYVTGQLQKPAFSFLHILRAVTPVQQWLLWLGVCAALFAPVLLYLVWLVYVGLGQGLIAGTAVAVAGALLMCMVAAAQLRYRLSHLHSRAAEGGGPGFTGRITLSYPGILLLQAAHTQKILWAGIKIYSCGVLYLVARNNTAQVYDISFPFLFFNFGVLVNGMVIYRLREVEETQLQFYRSLPVPLLRRWLGYGILYGVLLLPELITLAALTPLHLHGADAWRIAGVACSTVLLMHAISLLRAFKAGQYLKILALLFGVQIAFVIYSEWLCMSLLFLVAATLLFYYGYYRYQPVATAEAIMV